MAEAPQAYPVMEESGRGGAGTGGGARAGAAPGSAPAPAPPANSRAENGSPPAGGSELYQTTFRQTLDEGGLRRRRRSGNSIGEAAANVPPCDRDPYEDERKEPEKGGVGLWGLLTAPVKLGKAAIQSGVGVLNPFSWFTLMFGWLSEITPDRLKRLGEIVWDAMHHITDLAYTQPGAELGYSIRNVVDSFVETISAPKGRDVIIESAHVFVRAAEALDTPEAHATYAQVATWAQRGMEVLATEEAKDLIRNLNDMVSRAAKLSNAPETTVAVAEFVATICSQLDEEHMNFKRDRLREFATSFPSMSAFGGLGPEDGKGGKDRRASSSASATTPRPTVPPGFAEAEAAFRGEGEEAGAAAGHEGGEPISPSRQLPDWDRERLGATERDVSLFEERRRKVERRMGLREAIEGDVEKRRVGRDEARRAMTCAASFIFFVGYTVFALIGIRSTVTYVLTHQWW